MNRRQFVKYGSLVSLGFGGLKSYVNPSKFYPESNMNRSLKLSPGYGPLQNDPNGILNLPKGFSYSIISKRGETMADGLSVPGLADGMATFKGKGNRTIVVRNHEVSPNDFANGPFGANNEALNKIRRKKIYDFGRGKYPCLGGTTTFVYDHKKKKVVKQWLSLAGTIRNCAGGPTPWKSWISCEENVSRAGDILEKNHGYNFEVPASSKVKIYDPVPIKAMGRFNHEAVCVHPETGIVYQTEDRPDGLIYRFIPNVNEKLHDGGQLQILAIQEQESFDTRNWSDSLGYSMEIGKKYSVKWLDIDDVEAPEDDLRFRGVAMGAAVFARGEGMWYGQNEFYFACTNGGQQGHGQIFKYTPSNFEGTKEEQSNPGVLELFVEPNDSEIVRSADNLTIGKNGDLIICEDHSNPRIVGITPEGEIFHLAKNVGYQSEFAGGTFSPDGMTFFVNIQGPGLTLAIEGPWGKHA